jgi:lysophospholipase L1-like esterase
MFSRALSAATLTTLVGAGLLVPSAAALGTAPSAAMSMSGEAPAPAPTPDKPLRVLLLGDSFSAGNGARDFAGQRDYAGPEGCLRSPSNWASQYVEMLRGDGYNVLLENHACSGAVTRDVLEAQAEFVGPETDLVLMTIGGNDI